MTLPRCVDTSGWVAYFDRSDTDHTIFKECLISPLPIAPLLLCVRCTTTAMLSRETVIFAFLAFCSFPQILHPNHPDAISLWYGNMLMTIRSRSTPSSPMMPQNEKEGDNVHETSGSQNTSYARRKGALEGDPRQVSSRASVIGRTG